MVSSLLFEGEQPLCKRFPNEKFIVGVEGGGTTFAVSIARVLELDKIRSYENEQVKMESDPKSLGLEILLEKEFPTADRPQETLDEIVKFLQFHKNSTPVYSALGLACFGPLGVDPERSSTYGTILASSPKANWREVDILTPLLKACSVDGTKYIPHKIETDVNAPAFAEFTAEKQHHPDSKLSSIAYVTVGTGVGVGLVVNNKTVHGMLHPEGGQVCVQPYENDNFPGYSWGEKCPYKGKNTVEGMSCSVSLVERLEFMQREENTIHLIKNSPDGNARDILKNLENTHPIWDYAARGLANLCVTLILVNSVERIVFGGGIMRRGEPLLEKIRKETKELLNGYIDTKELRDMKSFIAPSRFGESAGIIGALMLGKVANEEYHNSLKPSKTSFLGGFGPATKHEDDSKTITVKASTVANNLFWNGFATGICVAAVLAVVLLNLDSKSRASPQQFLAKR